MARLRGNHGGPWPMAGRSWPQEGGWTDKRLAGDIGSILFLTCFSFGHCWATTTWARIHWAVVARAGTALCWHLWSVLAHVGPC